MHDETLVRTSDGHPQQQNKFNKFTQVAKLKVQCKQRYGLLKDSDSGSLMPTKTSRRDYNELLPGLVMSRTLINPAPGNTQRRGACKNLFIYES